jgi:uncharacterized protein YecE (DUF72 family)
MGRAYIGTSGWNYKHWSNDQFYPKGLNTSYWLKFFARQFDTVEINNSFYRLPSEEAFQNWRTQVPPEFTFAVKASRFLTHIKRLKDRATSTCSARDSSPRPAGPVLFQLPPRFKINLDRRNFFGSLPTHEKRVRCVAEWRREPARTRSLRDAARASLALVRRLARFTSDP